MKQTPFGDSAGKRKENKRASGFSAELAEKADAERGCAQKHGNCEPRAAFFHQKAENAAETTATPRIKQKNGSQQKIGTQHTR